MSRAIKGAGVDPDDGEHIDDQPGRRTYHGGNPKWEVAKSLGQDAAHGRDTEACAVVAR